MTHKSYYVSAGALCDGTTRIYTVMIGDSVQGRRDHDFLQSYAISHGHYFEKVSLESDIFIRNLRDSLTEFDIRVQLISARDLVKLFKQGIATSLDQSHLCSADYQLKMLDSSYRIISNLNRQACQSAKRST